MNIKELIDRSMTNRANERPLEYAFAWSCLAPLLLVPEKHRRRIRILDVGGADSLLSKTLANLGFDTTVIDINPVDHGKAKYICANILTYDFPEQSFDIIIAISTIEHIGLQCYGQDIQDPDGDIKTMEKIHRWLRNGGLAIITLPYGKPHHPPTFERTYNKDTLKDRILRHGWNILRLEYTCNNGTWRQCLEQEANTHDAAVLMLLQKHNAYK